MPGKAPRRPPSEPPRPAGVDDGSVYVAAERVWTHGQLDTDGQRTGRWRTWDHHGLLLEDAQYEDGVLHGAARHWVRRPSDFLDESIIGEAGVYARGARVGRWELFGEGNRTIKEVAYGMGEGLELRALAAWSNESRDDWEAQGRTLVDQDHVPAGLVTLLRSVSRTRTTARLEAAIATAARVLRDEPARAVAENAPAELPALATALVHGARPAIIAQRLAALLDEANQGPAALDFVNAALVIEPGMPAALFTRATVLMSLGLPEHAQRDATELAAAEPERAELLLDSLRVYFPRFTFWPEDEKLPATQGGPRGPVKKLEEIQALVQKYATRLEKLRKAILVLVRPEATFVPPSLSALLPVGPVPLRRGGAPGQAAYDESLAVGGRSLPELLTMARADWAALTWLLWACGEKGLHWPTRLEPPRAFPHAVAHVGLRLSEVRRRAEDARGPAASQTVEFEGVSVAELDPSLARVALVQYQAVSALMAWLGQPSIRSPWQDGLVGSQRA